jgi:hypothetical protein
MKILNEFIHNLILETSNTDADGRVNSIDDEKKLIKRLVEHCEVQGVPVYEPRPRFWYDIMIDGNPVQIKSSSCNAADNWSSKKSLLYALTNMTIEEINNCSNRHSDVQELLSSRLLHDNEPRDMDILIINKNDGRVHHRKLCQLHKLVSNGNNLPFQINWGTNLKQGLQLRTMHEAKKFIFEAYLSSIRKKRSQDKPELLEAVL